MQRALRSARFWMAVVAAAILVANQGLGLNLPNETITAFALLVITYLLGDTAVDVARIMRK